MQCRTDMYQARDDVSTEQCRGRQAAGCSCMLGRRAVTQAQLIYGPLCIAPTSCDTGLEAHPTTTACPSIMPPTDPPVPSLVQHCLQMVFASIHRMPAAVQCTLTTRRCTATTRACAKRTKPGWCACA